MVPSRQQTHRVSKRPTPTPSRAGTKRQADTGNRVLTDVLLAIKPTHLANIIIRQKNHEYRKYRLRDGVERLWLYETGGGNGRSAITSVFVLCFPFPFCVRLIFLLFSLFTSHSAR